MFSWDFPNFWNGSEECYPDIEVRKLDASPKASLNWTLPDQLEVPTLWELDFGLENLPLTLTDPQQFHTLALACEHFIKTVWNRFEEMSVGCVLYRGSLDFQGNFSEDEALLQNWNAWQQEQQSTEKILFYRDVVAQYLQLLAEHLPGISCFLLADVQKEPLLLQGKLLDRTVWSSIHPIPKEGLSWEPLTWKGEKVFPTSVDQAPDVAICLPSSYQLGEKFVKAVSERNQPFRWIPEEYLVQEWHGVDQLIVDSTTQAPDTPRMLQGFSIAGGITQLA